ncbi:MAG: hypothetical protein Kow0068_15850 [Marinilabiliales bacterium]
MENIYLINTTNGNYIFSTYLDGKGFKYYYIDPANSNIKIYNLNYTIHKTITVPYIMPTANNKFGVSYLSTNLFDTDTSNIEYMWRGMNENTYVSYIIILREDGTILFEDSNYFGLDIEQFFQQYPIFQTDSGTKMMLYYMDNTAKIYSLPGKLPCLECSEYFPSKVDDISLLSNSNIQVYPNPNNDIINIKYNLPIESKYGDIIIVDMNGIEIKHISLKQSNGIINISGSELNKGKYLIYLKTENKVVGIKKFIKI